MRVAQIYNESVVDGTGWRMAIFFQGCNHNCKGCHNPESHDFNGGEEISKEQLIAKIQEQIDENPLLDGVTLSGGDPFFQAEDMIDICKFIHSKDLNIWAYTGFTYEQLINKSDNRVTDSMVEMLHNIDVLVDGRFVLAQRSLEERFKGSLNQRIIDVQASLKNNRVVELELEA